jgi:hypothetical protein
MRSPAPVWLFWLVSLLAFGFAAYLTWISPPPAFAEPDASPTLYLRIWGGPGVLLLLSLVLTILDRRA